MSDENAEVGFECSVCYDAVLAEKMVVIQHDDVCHDCVTQLFVNAVTDESMYPVQWRSKDLDIYTYKDIVPEEVQRDFAAKALEYGVKPADRAYCTTHGCGEFLSARNPEGGTGACGGCGVVSCARCGQTKIQCVASNCYTPSDEEASFKGLERGKDFQLCPAERCGRKVQLWDGCNHIICVCRTQFCYVCGEELGHRDQRSHWRAGGCPRFGRQGESNVIFDDDVLPVPPMFFRDAANEQDHHQFLHHFRRGAMDEAATHSGVEDPQAMRERIAGRIRETMQALEVDLDGRHAPQDHGQGTRNSRGLFPWPAHPQRRGAPPSGRFGGEESEQDLAPLQDRQGQDPEVERQAHRRLRSRRPDRSREMEAMREHLQEAQERLQLVRQETARATSPFGFDMPRQGRNSHLPLDFPLLLSDEPARRGSAAQQRTRNPVAEGARQRNSKPFNSLFGALPVSSNEPGRHDLHEMPRFRRSASARAAEGARQQQIQMDAMLAASLSGEHPAQPPSQAERRFGRPSRSPGAGSDLAYMERSGERSGQSEHGMYTRSRLGDSARQDRRY